MKDGRFPLAKSIHSNDTDYCNSTWITTYARSRSLHSDTNNRKADNGTVHFLLIEREKKSMWNESYSNAFSERISIRNKLPALQQHASWTSLYEQYPYTPLSHRGHPLLIGPGNWPGGCNGGNGCAGFTDFKKPPFKKWLPSIVNMKKNITEKIISFKW